MQERHNYCNYFFCRVKPYPDTGQRQAPSSWFHGIFKFAASLPSALRSIATFLRHKIDISIDRIKVADDVCQLA